MPAEQYLWMDGDGSVYESPLTDHEARGRCSGIPTCCVAYYQAGGEISRLAFDWGYVACPACIAAGNRVEVRHCGVLREACTCGQWASRETVATEPDHCDEHVSPSQPLAAHIDALCESAHRIGRLEMKLQVDELLVVLGALVSRVERTGGYASHDEQNALWRAKAVLAKHGQQNAAPPRRGT